MDTNVKEANKVRIDTVIKGLEKRNITGHYCETAADAVKTIESLIAEGSQVSWGGSATLNEIGIKDVLKAGNYDVNDPMDPSIGRDESTMRRKKALTCDAFLASLNAITMDGEIVNVDGTGNRIAAIAFGPDKVILVAGVNKIVNEEKDAIGRILTDACPPNCIRLGKKTPCAVTGKCGDCLSVGNTICSYTVVTRFSPEPDRLHVVMVNEVLGY